jgi:hypothetical protein
MLSFEPAVIHPTGDFPLEVVTADFNNDGQPDLATADAFSNSVSILLGRANGTFNAARQVDTGPVPQSIAAGDFNADGRLDLATANYDDVADHDISILLGRGDGQFDAASPQKTGLPEFSVAIATGYVNSDKKLDLIVLSDDFFGSHQLSVLLGDGAGNFTNFATYGHQDFGQLRSPVMADFNHDGRTDVAVSDWQTGSVRVFLGHGDGTLHVPRDFATGLSTNAVAIGDFNTDGKLDLAVTTFNDNRVKLLLGKGDGTFQSGQSFAAGSGPTSVKAADVSGDGHLDIVVTNRGTDPTFAGAVSVLLGGGDGSFGQPITIATSGSYANSLALADFNGDHRIDAAVTNQRSDSASVFINDGNWPISPPQPPSPRIAINDMTKAEGNAKSTLFTFTVTLSSASSQAVTVNYATANGTATGGTDYQSKNGSMTYAPGETSKTITVSVNGDKQKEADETFFVNLSGAIGGQITDSQGLGTILNDDGGGGLKSNLRLTAWAVDAAIRDWTFYVSKKRVI